MFSPPKNDNGGDLRVRSSRASGGLGRMSVIWSATAGILAATMMVTLAYTLKANGIG